MSSSSTPPPPRRSKTISSSVGGEPQARRTPATGAPRSTIQMRRAASKDQRRVSQTNYTSMRNDDGDGAGETNDKSKRAAGPSKAAASSKIQSRDGGKPAATGQEQTSKTPGVARESQEAAYLNQQNSREPSSDSIMAAARGPAAQQPDERADNITIESEHNMESGHSQLLPAAGGLTKNLVWAVCASAVGASFQHGYNNGVMNAPEKLIGEFINDTYRQRNNGAPASENQIDFVFAIIVSVFCVGGCAGALLTALVADRVGRKEGLMYNNLLVLLACPMMASARALSSYELLIAGRLIIGINAGLNAGLAPLYLNEIAPVQLRGAFGTIYQLVITISILLSNVFGLPSLFGDRASWPILFALPILPAAFMLTVLPNLCESPKFLLLNQGKELQAQQALAWFRQTNDVQDEMEELRNERELNRLANRSCSLRDMFRDPALSRPLTIAIVIMLSQQFSGINAVLFYSTSIFRDAGLGEQAAVRATLGMGLVNVVMTLVSLFLVDRAGRRTLHMTGLMGMAATCLVLAICIGSPQVDTPPTTLASSISILSIYVFIAMFASGPGAIPWFLVAELFPSTARPVASSIAVAVNWLANFTVSLCFLPLSNILHGYTFLLFAALLVIFYLFTYYKVPETKGATAEEISALFKR